MIRKILFVILALLAITSATMFLLRKRDVLDVELLTSAAEPQRNDAVRFIGVAMDTLKKNGTEKFRNYWIKVDEMQYSANMNTLKGMEHSTPTILNAVNPKGQTGRIYVYARFPGENDYDVQFVLVKSEQNFRIAGIYENREFRK